MRRGRDGGGGGFGRFLGGEGAGLGISWRKMLCFLHESFVTNTYIHISRLTASFPNILPSTTSQNPAQLYTCKPPNE